MDLSIQDKILGLTKVKLDEVTGLLRYAGSHSTIQWSHLVLIFMDLSVRWGFFVWLDFFHQISNFIASTNIQFNYFRLLRFQTH